MASKIILFFFMWSLYISLEAQSKDCHLADSLSLNQNYPLAVEKYNICYLLDTFNKKPLASLANCYLLLGDYAQAKQCYHILENDSTTSHDAISKLAIIYEAQQNLPKAIKYYKALQKLFPYNPIYLRKLGALYLQGREPSQALVSYQEAIRLNPRDVLSIQGLSEIYFNNEAFTISDSILDTGILLDSTNIGLLLLKARIKYRTRDYGATSQILFRLSSLTELNNYYNKLIGYSFMQIDSLDKAIYHLQKSLLNENDPEYALFYLALAHEMKKEYERAEWYFQEAAKSGISENMDQYHRGLARVYTHEGDIKKVLQQYQKSLEYEHDPEVYFFMATAAEQYYKDKSKAIKYYQLYLDSEHHNTEWIQISKDRMKILKEQKFMSRSSKT